MFAALEDLQQTDHVRMLNLLQEVDLLEDLALAELVFHVALLYRLDGHLLARQLMHPQGYLPEGALADQLHELIEIERCGRELVGFIDMALDVFDEALLLL